MLLASALFQHVLPNSPCFSPFQRKVMGRANNDCCVHWEQHVGLTHSAVMCCINKPGLTAAEFRLPQLQSQCLRMWHTSSWGQSKVVLPVSFQSFRQQSQCRSGFAINPKYSKVMLILAGRCKYHRWWSFSRKVLPWVYKYWWDHHLKYNHSAKWSNEISVILNDFRKLENQNKVLSNFIY